VADEFVGFAATGSQPILRSAPNGRQVTSSLHWLAK
jgi:hypothetical protein